MKKRTPEQILDRARFLSDLAEAEADRRDYEAYCASFESRREHRRPRATVGLGGEARSVPRYLRRWIEEESRDNEKGGGRFLPDGGSDWF